jgi:hypothetical protein
MTFVEAESKIRKNVGRKNGCSNCSLYGTKLGLLPKSEMTVQFSCRRKSENHKRHSTPPKLTQSITEQSNLRGSPPTRGARRKRALDAHACTCKIQFEEATWLQPHCNGEGESSPRPRKTQAHVEVPNGITKRFCHGHRTEWKRWSVCWSSLH